MLQIKKESSNFEIKNNYSYNFEISESGTHLIEIIASAKSWWQNFKSLKSFFKDDDLAVKIATIEFPKLNGKSGLFDGEATWNGNNLKGLSKTNIFIINLVKGNLDLNFSADQSPILESIAIYKIDEAEINYVPEKNNPAQDGDRRQWVTIIPANVLIKKLNIKASVKKYPEKKDDDDIKIIIDGNIQKNESAKSHKNWFWCGRILNGHEKEFDKELNFESVIHYIELWADGMPVVKNINLSLEIESENNQEKPTPKRIPAVGDPRWTGDFGDDSEQMILARAIFGEARSLPEKGRIAVGWSIRNRVEDSRWKDTYHEVILQPLQYSAFNENDKNFPFVKNPFIDKAQIDDWQVCYELAGKIIKNEVSDPTDGANHYFSNYIDYPAWTQKSNAEFKIKIGNTLFYDLKDTNKGFIQIKIGILIFIGVILMSGFLYAATETIKYNTRLTSNTIEVESYRHYFINQKTNEVQAVSFDKYGDFLRINTEMQDHSKKGQIKTFADSTPGTVGYLQKVPAKEKSNEDDRDYTVFMVKSGNGEFREAYRTKDSVLEWKWLDEKHADIFFNCGTGCQRYQRINIDTKEIEDRGTILIESFGY